MHFIIVSWDSSLKNAGLLKSDIFQVKKEVEVDNATRRKAARKVC